MNKTMKTMSPLIPPRDDEFLRKLVRRASAINGREFPNFLRILAHSPATLKACLNFNNALDHGLLAPQVRVRIALLMVELNCCRYSLSIYGEEGRRVGLSEEEIRQARQAKAGDPVGTAVLRFTLDFVLQRGRISPKELAALKSAGFSDAHVVEIIANIAENMFVNYFNISMATPVDFRLVSPGTEI
jgi:alkylhydroperoxidase family enzyme